MRKGRFELADRGTLFLDEIGGISPAFQAKLLRVLQEGEFERVGGMRTLKVDVRWWRQQTRIRRCRGPRGFSGRSLLPDQCCDDCRSGSRARPDDIFLLARQFLRRFNEEHATQLTWTMSAKAVLEGCYFPGNVRELENCVRRTATLAKGQKIVADDFACRHDECLSSTLWKGTITEPGPSSSLSSRPANFTAAPNLPAPVAAPESRLPPLDVDIIATQPEDCPQAANCGVAHGEGQAERERLFQAMETAGWVQAKAARLLNLTPRQMGYALRKYNIPIRRF